MRYYKWAIYFAGGFIGIALIIFTLIKPDIIDQQTDRTGLNLHPNVASYLLIGIAYNLMMPLAIAVHGRQDHIFSRHSIMVPFILIDRLLFWPVLHSDAITRIIERTSAYRNARREAEYKMETIMPYTHFVDTRDWAYMSYLASPILLSIFITLSFSV